MNKNKYRLIYEHLLKQIQNGRLQPNALLPSENELATTFESSRETVRKALKLLSEHGFIQKIQGKGSIVLEQAKIDFPVSGHVSFKELAENMEGRSRTLIVSQASMPIGASLAKRMQASAKENVWELQRIREVDGERVILDKDYIRQSIVPRLKNMTGQDSLYEYLEQELGLDISYAIKEITVDEPTEEDIRLLDFSSYSSIVVVRSLIYLEDTTLFQFTESRHRPDKFRFVEFARRGR